MKKINTKKNYVAELYAELEKIPDELKDIHRRVVEDDDFLDFEEELDNLKLKEEYLNEYIQITWERQNLLRSLNAHPEQLESLMKELKSDKIWDIFLDTLKSNEWVPVVDDLCETCGRVHSSTTSVAAVYNQQTNEYKIICSRCFRESLQQGEN